MGWVVSPPFLPLHILGSYIWTCDHSRGDGSTMRSRKWPQAIRTQSHRRGPMETQGGGEPPSFCVSLILRRPAWRCEVVLAV